VEPFFLEYEIGGHGKIEGGAVMTIRMVSVNLNKCSMRGVGAEVAVEVVLPDRAKLLWVFPGLGAETT
jgi:hypothetical protein